MNTEKQKQIILALENLVHSRFNQETLEKKLSDIFNETIKLEEAYIDVDTLADWNLIFESKQEEIGGIFDIYILKHKNTDIQGNTMYVTEVGYEFD